MTIDERDRQTDHIAVTTLNGRDKSGSSPLDGVGSGLISWLPAPSVLLNFVLGKLDEGNFRTGEIDNPPIPRENADSGVDPMIAAGQEPQHVAGVFVARGFSEHPIL